MTINTHVPDTKSVTYPKLNYSDLSRNQKQKFAHLRGIYEDEDTILKLTLLIEPRGENSWKSIYDKIAAIRRGDYKQQMYDDTLYENFIVGTEHSPDDIIKIVGSVRYDMDLPPYLSSLKRNCERDFFKLFVVETISTDAPFVDKETGEPKTKKVVVGYRPLFRLKPEE